MSHTERFLDLVDEAKKNVGEVSVAEVADMLQRGDRFFLIDVREESEWAQGHVRGARHLGKGIIERDISSLVRGEDVDIVLYCGGGYRSVLAAENLKRMGYANVRSMRGGIRDWIDEGLPVERPAGRGAPRSAARRFGR